MTIVLDNYTIPENGNIHIDLQLSFAIIVSAQDAQQIVGRWVRDEISLLMQAKRPTLVVGEQRVWRVPIEITFPISNGNFAVDTVDVDVTTGAIVTPLRKKEAILHLLETRVRPFAPTRVTPQPLSA